MTDEENCDTAGCHERHGRNDRAGGQAGHSANAVSAGAARAERGPDTGQEPSGKQKCRRRWDADLWQLSGGAKENQRACDHPRDKGCTPCPVGVDVQAEQPTDNAIDPGNAAMNSHKGDGGKSDQEAA